MGWKRNDRKSLDKESQILSIVMYLKFRKLSFVLLTLH